MTKVKQLELPLIEAPKSKHQQVIANALELLQGSGYYGYHHEVDDTMSDADRRNRHRWNVDRALQRACDNLWAEVNNYPPLIRRHGVGGWPAAWVRARDVGFSKAALANAAAELDRVLK
jgi:hypothetical protein